MRNVYYLRPVEIVCNGLRWNSAFHYSSWFMSHFCQCCQMVYIFLTKNPNSSKFWKRLVFLWPFCLFYGQTVFVFYGYLVHFVVIWYIFSCSGMLYGEKSGNPVWERKICTTWVRSAISVKKSIYKWPRVPVCHHRYPHSAGAAIHRLLQKGGSIQRHQDLDGLSGQFLW
jgi:hypothetical protein